MAYTYIYIPMARVSSQGVVMDWVVGIWSHGSTADMG